VEKMDVDVFKEISPFVRMMRIKKAMAMSGKWRDIDNVFTYIAQGSAEFIVDGDKYVCSVGDIIIIPPLKTHIVRSLGTEPLVQFIFHFDFYERPESRLMKHQDVLGVGVDFEISERERIFGEHVIISNFGETERYEIKKLYLNMYKEFTEGQECKGVMLKAYSTLLLINSLRNGTKSPGKLTSDLTGKKTKTWVHIENAVAYINMHYMSEDLDNDTISYAIGVTPNYLTNVFGNYVGISLHKYIINMKIEKAQQMLTLGHMNITEAAEKAGFSSIHAFSKTFKAVVGMTPSEYLNYVAQKETIIPTGINIPAGISTPAEVSISAGINIFAEKVPAGINLLAPASRHTNHELEAI
jgi:AraC-like DNA-binding protein